MQYRRLKKIPRYCKSINAQAREKARQVQRTNRAIAAIAFMDKHEGYGWRRRMEKRDHYMDQDHPRRWIRGDVPSWEQLRKFEEYAARFGYKMPPTHPEYLTFQQPVYQPEVRASLNNLSTNE